MTTTTRRAAYASMQPSILSRLVTLVRTPFTHVYASPIWLAVRLYLGYMWFWMGVQKLQIGFLSSDPIGPILKAVADGTLKVPAEFFRPVAGLLVDSGLTPLISFSMPFLEIAVALSFVTGVLVVPAAVGATLLNIIFVLSGIGQIRLDGRFIALQLLLILAYRIVGTIGFQKLATRMFLAALVALRIKKATPAAARS
jgi:thiosulfate dehydrogenase (quinone) large subunit